MELRNRDSVHQLFLHSSRLTARFAREFSNDRIPLRSNGLRWRSYVYQRRLYALPLHDVTGRVRIITARFYRYVKFISIIYFMDYLFNDLFWFFFLFLF